MHQIPEREIRRRRAPEGAIPRAHHRKREAEHPDAGGIPGVGGIGREIQKPRTIASAERKTSIPNRQNTASTSAERQGETEDHTDTTKADRLNLVLNGLELERIEQEAEILVGYRPLRRESFTPTNS